MSECGAFRAAFAPGCDDATLLTHLRQCDPCLDHAAHADPEVMFRALGGDGLVPPGGIDLFVGDVMKQVRLRTTEKRTVQHEPVSWTRRLALAATLAATLSGALLVYQRQSGPESVARPVEVAAAAPRAVPAKNLATKPIVETYDSPDATIVELETSGDGTQIVMIFDESLPADL